MSRTAFLLIGITFLLASFSAHAVLKEDRALLLQGYKLQQSKMGHEMFIREKDNEVHTVVNWHKKALIEKPADIKSIHDVFAKTPKNKIKEAVLKCTANANHTKVDYFQFLARTIGTVSPQQPSFKFEGRCFEEIDVSYHKLSSSKIQLVFNAKKRNFDPLCLDYYVVGTLFDLHIELIYLPGKHKLTLKNLSPEHMAMIEKKGLHIFGFCDQLIYLLPDVLKTAMLFVGGLGLNPNIPFFGSKPPSWMERMNVDFIREATGFEWKKRKDVDIDLDEKDVPDGAFIAVTRFDGLDQIIEYFAGSHAGHCTVAMRIDGVLYVLESQNAWYWPTTQIQRTPYKQWVKWAKNAGFNVAIVPLKKEVEARWNKTAAVEWFKKVEGMPYGFHTFVYTALDTPNDNMPPVVDSDFLLSLVNVLWKILPDAFDSVFGEAFNFRLGTKNLRFEEIYAEVLRRNLTLQEVWSLPERDGTWYSDGFAYVCSSFVVGLYKAGGMFGDLEIHATEMTPRDLYLLDIFDQHPEIPQICKDTDPDLPYCQILGTYKMELPGFGTLKPYNHMSEKCGTLPPDYTRAEGC